jgi:cytochrome b6-f complex iron-sulfur subunit
MNRRDFIAIPFKLDSPAETEAEKTYPPITSTPTAGFPRQYARHTLVLVQDARAWLGRDDLGFYAVDATCPHLGCTVRPVESGFACPCHHSTFAADGEVTSGPAKNHLRYLQVDLNHDGKLVIRRECMVSPDDRFIA